MSASSWLKTLSSWVFIVVFSPRLKVPTQHACQPPYIILVHNYIFLGQMTGYWELRVDYDYSAHLILSWSLADISWYLSKTTIFSDAADINLGCLPHNMIEQLWNVHDDSVNRFWPVLNHTKMFDQTPLCASSESTMLVGEHRSKLHLLLLTNHQYVH